MKKVLDLRNMSRTEASFRLCFGPLLDPSDIGGEERFRGEPFLGSREIFRAYSKVLKRCGAKPPSRFSHPFWGDRRFSYKIGEWERTLRNRGAYFDTVIVPRQDDCFLNFAAWKAELMGATVTRED